MANIVDNGTDSIILETATGTGDLVRESFPSLIEPTLTGDIDFPDQGANNILALDGSKQLTSIETTGTDKVVKSLTPSIDSPTITGDITLPDLVATNIVALDSSKNITSLSTTGTGSVVKQTSPSLTTPTFSGTPIGTITSGTYSPSIGYSGNITSASGSGFKYIRIGDIANITGLVTYVCNSNSGVSSFTVPVPIGQNFTQNYQLIGVISTSVNLPGTTPSSAFQSTVVAIPGSTNANGTLVNSTTTLYAVISFQYQIQ
jgi:hypothetical protein